MDNLCNNSRVQVFYNGGATIPSGTKSFPLGDIKNKKYLILRYRQEIKGIQCDISGLTLYNKKEYYSHPSSYYLGFLDLLFIYDTETDTLELKYNDGRIAEVWFSDTLLLG